MNSQDYIDLDEKYGAHNYHPLPVVISWAEGCKVRDPEGKSYFDFLSAYSAVNQGHRHPKIVAAAREQLERCTLTSRAFHNDRTGAFLKKLCEHTLFEVALPMNTGAEAVETALKAARRWGAEVKGVKNGEQEIICAEGNFHGRTLAAISMSVDPDSLVNYGPYVPGFVKVPYGDAKAVEALITPRTVAVFVEPIQGEAGVVVPPEGYLAGHARDLHRHNVLFLDDEVQTGFCRVGRRFAWQREDARPDIMCLGKALGGGILPVSAIVADHRRDGRLHARRPTAPPSAATRSPPQSASHPSKSSRTRGSMSGPKGSALHSAPRSERCAAPPCGRSGARVSSTQSSSTSSDCSRFASPRAGR